MNERIRNLLDLGRLVHEAAPDEEVLGLWAHALEAYEDACLTNRAPARRLLSAYDAGRVAALAVVRAADLRVRAQNHHEVTLAVAGILAGAEVEGLVQEFQALRLERVQIEYGWKGRASSGDVEKALARVRLLLVHASRAIRESRPALEREIAAPS